MSMVEKLAYLKKRDKLTTEDLAARSGVPLGTLNKIMAGQTRQPSASTLIKISDVFDVPVRYLAEDAIPLECDLPAYAEQMGFLQLTRRELEYLERFRALAPRDRLALEAVIDNYWFRSTAMCAPLAEGERILPCYIATTQGRRGAFGEGMALKTIRAPITRITEQADFTVRVGDGSVLPVYKEGELLACHSGEAMHNELGVFIFNNEVLIRKYYRKRDVVKLSSINKDVKDLRVLPGDHLQCRGVILGAVRQYQWC